MKVRFNSDCLADPAAWDSLDQIVTHFHNDRHIWDIIDPDAVLSSDWVKSDITGRTGRRITEFVQKAVTAAAYPQGRLHKLTLTITNSPTTADDLSPLEGARCLSMPALVAVENRESDGAFLRAIATAYGRAELLGAMDVGWCDLEQLGGYGEIEKALNYHLPRRPGPCRVFVLADSDRQYPGHRTPTIDKIESACTARGVPFYILEKRKIENYIPLVLLDKLKRRDRFRAFQRLTPEQRDYYEMKGGFREHPAGKAEIPDEQQMLFDKVPAPVLRDLCGGFGKDSWAVFRDDVQSIREGELEAICSRCPGELPRLLDAIERII
jgi:hypothetical protein